MNPASQAIDEPREDARLATNPAAVSVIIPCYNQAEFLGEALGSVKHQEYSPLEIIVVDDGSTDNTGSVAASFAGVRIIRGERKGLAAARNAGASVATGEYLVFLDADDRLIHGAIRAGAQALDARPGWGMVHGHFRFINQNGERIDRAVPACVENDCHLALVRRNYVEMIGSVMIRRDIFLRSGGFDSRLRACEDHDLYLRIARNFGIACHHGMVAEYRRHASNMSTDPARMLRSAFTVLRLEWERADRNAALRNAVDEAVKVYSRHFRYVAVRSLLSDFRHGRLSASSWRLLREIVRGLPSDFTLDSHWK